MKLTIATTSLLVALTISLATAANTEGEVEEYCPVEIRRRPWSELSSEDKASALALNYTSITWNYDGTYNWVEDMWKAVLTQAQQDAATDLGYITEDQWDCCVNHYYSYLWEELDEFEVAAFEEFGWNATNAVSGINPSDWDLYWDGLSDVQKDAAKILCYTPEMWDVVPLTTNSTAQRRDFLRSRRVR